MALDSDLRIDVKPSALGRAALSFTPVNTFLPRSGPYNGAYKNFGPHLGIAWTPRVLPKLLGTDKTVIRTGFRLSYDEVFHTIPVNMGLNVPAVLTTVLPTSAYTWATTLSQNRSLFSADATVPGGQRGITRINAWDTQAPSAYGMNYALEIDRQLGRDYALEVSYVGTLGRKLGVYVDANEPSVIVNDPTKRGDQAPNVRLWRCPDFR